MRALAVLAELVLLASITSAVAASPGCKGGDKNARLRRSTDAGPVEEVTSTEQPERRKATVAEREPNDRPAEAGALPFDAIGRGRMDGPGDVDRYRVKVEQPGALTVTVSGLATVDLIVELHDAAGAVLAKSDRGGAKISEGIGGYPVTAGSYDVVVRAFEKPSKAKKAGKGGKDAKSAKAGSGAGSAAAAGSASAAGPVVIVEPSEEYEVIASFLDAAALAAAGPTGERQELEPNPDAGTAGDLAIGEVAAGLIGWAGDVDVWKISTEVLAGNNALDLELSSIEGVTLTLEVRDGMSRPQTVRKGGRGQPVTLRGYVPKVPEGTPPILYVAVSGDRSHPQLGYALKVSARMVSDSEELEPNDKPELAQPFISSSEEAPSYEGDGGSTLHARWQPGDVDCFAIPTAAAKRRVVVTVSAADSPTANLAAELLVGERVMATSDEPAGKLEQLEVDVPAGARAVVRVRAPAVAKGAKAPAGNDKEVAYDVAWSEAAPPSGADAMPPEEGQAGDGPVRTP